jgi:hypothetical protein
VRSRAVAAPTRVQDGIIEAAIDLVEDALIKEGGPRHILSLRDHVDGDMRTSVIVNI